ncbi:MAG: hypothetical protein U1C50_01865 [Patescibacteria group bacterium]|nr:hypothetical protein [Patescibacteria group bacterium]
MPTFAEYCPLRLIDKEITFTLEDGREPSPTKGCICGGSDQENAMRLGAGTATAANLSNALGDSILSGGKPVEYQSFEVKGQHNSVIRVVSE